MKKAKKMSRSQIMKRLDNAVFILLAIVSAIVFICLMFPESGRAVRNRLLDTNIRLYPEAPDSLFIHEEKTEVYESSIKTNGKTAANA